MVGAELVLGEWFASAIINAVVDKALLYLSNRYDSNIGIKDMLNKLEMTLPHIQAVIGVAERRIIGSPGLVTWLRQLKDAAYEADDVLDDFQFRFLRAQVKGAIKFSSFVSSLKAAKHSLLPDDDLIRLKKVVARLDGIASGVKDFVKLVELDDRDARQKPRMAERVETSSSIGERVVGRDVERDSILAMLLKSSGKFESSYKGGASTSSNPHLSVLPIIGIGGVGKTTLAQLIYNHHRVVEHFPLRMWVHMADNFDVKRLISQIIQSASNWIDAPRYRDTSLDVLESQLKDLLRNKRFLLVLDDVWEETGKLWVSLRNSLTSGAEGSTILVTTQYKSVAEMMGTIGPIVLDVLQQEDCWQLFQDCAFGNRLIEERRGEKLRLIGKEIVVKLHGLPLAVKVLGRLLRSKLDEDYWVEILRSEWWELDQGLNTILPSLGLSFRHLDARLKQCFAYCSVFPKNYIFEKKRLVQMWIAQGFIQPKKMYGRGMEDMGIKYFDDLVDRFFFQPTWNNRFVMHDLMRELAVSVSLDDCFVITDEPQKPPPTVRHICVQTDNLNAIRDLHKWNKLKSLRTILFFGDYDSSEFSKVLEDMFKQSGSLRVLDLSCTRTEIKTLPNAVGSLSHLRYLDLSGTMIKCLHVSFRKLCHLQVLNVRWCNFDQFPEGMSNLISLRHLYADDEMISQIASIGKLTNLQELEEFQVKEKKGHTIRELSNMWLIGGEIHIKGLENVKIGEEAMEANLSNKWFLDSLKLEWNSYKSDAITDMEEDVIDGLQPPNFLKNLSINHYFGIRAPRWMDNFNLVSLISVRLSDCLNWEVLPALGQLIHLQTLHLIRMPAIKEFGDQFDSSFKTLFPSLEELVFEEMVHWNKWPEVNEDCQLFPLLRKLRFDSCPQMKELPPLPLPSKVVELTVISCADLYTVMPDNFPARFTCLSSLKICDCPHIKELHLQNLVLLEKLCICNCSNLRLIDGIQVLDSLKHMEIIRCSRITMTPAPVEPHDVILHSLIHLCVDDIPLSIRGFLSIRLPFLRVLSIENCHDLESFSEEQEMWFQNLTSLQKLCIRSCHRLLRLPEHLATFSSLKELHIVDCRNIMSLPLTGLSETLTELHISNSPLLGEHCKAEGGTEWCKIAHIAYIRIDGETRQVL